jgi:hypothetical protein
MTMVVVVNTRPPVLVALWTPQDRVGGRRDIGAEPDVGAEHHVDLPEKPNDEAAHDDSYHDQPLQDWGDDCCVYEERQYKETREDEQRPEQRP